MGMQPKACRSRPGGMTRTGPVTRFASTAAYANYTATPPPNRQRRFLPAPAVPLRRPATELRDLHHRDRSRSGCRPEPAARTTTRKSPKANHRVTPPGRSNDTSPHTSGAPCWPTKPTPQHAFGRRDNRLLTNTEAPHRAFLHGFGGCPLTSQPSKVTLAVRPHG